MGGARAESASRPAPRSRSSRKGPGGAGGRGGEELWKLGPTRDCRSLRRGISRLRHFSTDGSEIISDH